MMREDIERLTALAPEAFIDKMLQFYYPYLFLLINRVEACIKGVESPDDAGLLRSIHARMNDELDGLYRKEKLVLYPYLLQLSAEGKKSDGCKPFKNVRGHYLSLIAALRQLKIIAETELSEGLDTEAYRLLKDDADLMEQTLSILQQVKEDHLFQKFRSCSNGCKSL
jgi:hypothetical protein